MPKLKNHEKGVGSVFIIAIVVVLAVAGVVTWQLTKKSSPKTPSSTNSTNTANTSGSVSSSCLKAYNDNALCAFAEHANISNQEYVATGTATNSTGSKSTYTVKNDGKGNTEVTYSSNGQQLSSINLDGATYIQTGTSSSWLEYSGTSLGAATAAPNPTSGFKLDFTTSTPAGVSVTKEGTTSCGSLTCYKYKVIDSSTPTATEYVYFDTSSYLLRQWTSNDTSSGISVDLTFSYPSVTITKPSPVQQIST